MGVDYGTDSLQRMRKKISDLADFCPKCGASTVHRSENAQAVLVVSFLLFVALLWVLAR